MQIRSVCTYVVALILIWFASPIMAADVQVARWQPHDFVFSSSAAQANPFRVAFSADVIGPVGIKFTVPGFFDGEGTWKVRVSPTVEGQWAVVTHSSVRELDNQRSSFVCVPNSSASVHGALRIDPLHPHQFVLEDGTRFLPIGYECDWLWALDTTDPGLKTIHAFLDKLAQYGFNFIILNTYAYDTSWRRGKTAEDDFGPPPLYAWEGSNDKPDHTRFNLPYWRHYDRVIEAMYRRGIVAHIFTKVYNKQVNWPANGSAEDDLYFRWLIARYSAYPNVSWDLSKEANNEKDLAYKVGRLRFIRSNDPYRRLITVHDDHATYDRNAYDDLLDYRSDQQHSKWRDTMLNHLQQHAWPVINAEFGYECGPQGLNDKTYNVAQSPEEVCRRAWEVYMAGGFGAYYYTYTAWDIIRPRDTPPGYTYFKYLREFFESTGYWRMKPVDGLTSDGYCLANVGVEYLIFLNTAAPFSLKLQGLSTPLQAQWYQPFTGKREDAGSLRNGTAKLTPPTEWRDGPVALHVGATRQ
jgi:hypothetical protein